MVEVDASDSGVGGVLSQQAVEDGKLHPCAFFSRALSPAERNYDVGNRELLALKLAVEEWRHWFEGAADPFLIYTDHKNLEYIRQSKRPPAGSLGSVFQSLQLCGDLPSRLQER